LSTLVQSRAGFSPCLDVPKGTTLRVAKIVSIPCWVFSLSRQTVHSSQRPQQLHETVISQSDRRFYFRLTNDRDLGKISPQTNFNVNSVPGIGKGLSELEDCEVVIENVDSGDVVVESTEDWIRIRPHYADDDGIIDEALPV